MKVIGSLATVLALVAGGCSEKDSASETSESIDTGTAIYSLSADERMLTRRDLSSDEDKWVAYSSFEEALVLHLGRDSGLGAIQLAILVHERELTRLRDHIPRFDARIESLDDEIRSLEADLASLQASNPVRDVLLEKLRSKRSERARIDYVRQEFYSDIAAQSERLREEQAKLEEVPFNRQHLRETLKIGYAVELSEQTILEGVTADDLDRVFDEVYLEATQGTTFDVVVDITHHSGSRDNTRPSFSFEFSNLPRLGGQYIGALYGAKISDGEFVQIEPGNADHPDHIKWGLIQAFNLGWGECGIALRLRGIEVENVDLTHLFSARRSLSFTDISNIFMRFEPYKNYDDRWILYQTASSASGETWHLVCKVREIDGNLATLEKALGPSR